MAWRVKNACRMMMNDNMMAKAICRAMTILTTVRFIGEK
jgi:hypothetical protein